MKKTQNIARELLIVKEEIFVISKKAKTTEDIKELQLIRKDLKRSLGWLIWLIKERDGKLTIFDKIKRLLGF